MRRALALGSSLVALALAQPALAAPTLTLHADRSVANYGAQVTFSGTLTEAPAGTPVYVLRGPPASPTEIAVATSDAAGAFQVAAAIMVPGSHYAVADVGGTQVASNAIGLRVRPTLTVRLGGRRALGRHLVIAGRLTPASAGRLVLQAYGRTRLLRRGADGRFRLKLFNERPGRIRLAVSVRPRPGTGYEPVRVVRTTTIRAPSLALGSSGPAVLALERRLRRLEYAIRGVNTRYRYDTYEAVLAFQKVHRMARTGRVGSAFWRAFATARVPRARVPRGNHIEISKTRQVLYEVRRGKVVNVVHVSTGATGNTPVGRWRVYRLQPGFNSLHMYYSMYFLRGFAIHGYPSVPPWPASHGCVRTPNWLAPGLYSRWGRVGSRIYVFA